MLDIFNTLIKNFQGIFVTIYLFFINLKKDKQIDSLKDEINKKVNDDISHTTTLVKKEISTNQQLNKADSIIKTDQIMDKINNSPTDTEIKITI